MSFRLNAFFYEKGVKVKADVAASLFLYPVTYRSPKTDRDAGRKRSPDFKVSLSTSRSTGWLTMQVSPVLKNDNSPAMFSAVLPHLSTPFVAFKSDQGSFRSLSILAELSSPFMKRQNPVDAIQRTIVWVDRYLKVKS